MADHAKEHAAEAHQPTPDTSTRQLPAPIAEKHISDFDTILKRTLMAVAILFIVAVGGSSVFTALGNGNIPGNNHTTWWFGSPGSVRYVEEPVVRPSALRPSTDCPATPQVVVLQGDVRHTINPGGQCVVHWAFNGKIDAIDTTGGTRKGVTGTDYLEGFWTEGVQSHDGSHVVMNYTLAAN